MLSRLAAAIFLIAGQAAGYDDVRITALARHFEAAESPLLSDAAEFVAAADRFHLDWRLLPALAIVETAAGKSARDNNLFGWGRRRFESARAAIWHVAEELAESDTYRGKSTREKLIAFNRRHARRFPLKVEKVMAALGPPPSAIH